MAHPTGRRKLAAILMADVVEYGRHLDKPGTVRIFKAHRLRAKVMAQGANMPCMPGAEDWLHGKGVVILAGFIADAGGVIYAATEFRGAT